MGLQVFKTTPFASSSSSTTKSLLTTATATATKSITSGRSFSNPCNIRLRFPFSSQKAIACACSVSSSGVESFLHQMKRRYHGSRLLAMAASGSIQKSEEEWRAILSPQQFRILRQKGTEKSLLGYS